MTVFRIALRTHINDLSGTGAKLYGGRWNRPGTAILYTSENRSLAALEYLVHLPAAFAPADLAMATIQIPDDVSREEVEIGALPDRWRHFPAPPELADLGTSWAQASRTLLLRVPSAVVDQEFNILINPEHPEMKRVTLLRAEAFAFDDRLLE